jgi:hypothetical protein
MSASDQGATCPAWGEDRCPLLRPCHGDSQRQTRLFRLAPSCVVAEQSPGARALKDNDLIKFFSLRLMNRNLTGTEYGFPRLTHTIGHGFPDWMSG